MNIGVSIVPWPVVISPALASEPGHVACSWKFISLLIVLQIYTKKAKSRLLLGRYRGFFTSVALYGIVYNPLQLPVDGAELVCRPLFYGGHGGGVDAQQEAFVAG
jgi:hypothetical protein